MATDLTGATVELLQTLIRNACVNDGTAASGHETRNADVLEAYVARPGIMVERFEPTPGRRSFVARVEGTTPSAPSLCLMGHTDVVPADPRGWRRDPFGGELVAGDDGVDEVWGRGAVDMLNLTSSMAVAFVDLVERGVRPAGDLLYFAVADEEAGSALGARWVAEHAADSIRCDYVLTESGGLHTGTPAAPRVGVTVGEKGVAWRRLRITGTPGHGSMPYRISNALVTAAAVVQRLAEYRPAPRFHELWTERVRSMAMPDDAKAALLDPARIDDFLAEIPDDGAAAQLHACTHTTFSPNVVDGGTMKTNVIPGTIELDVDVRTMPGDDRAEVEAHLRCALGDLADRVEVTELLHDPASMSSTGTPLWDALADAVAVPFPDARLLPEFTVGFTDSRVFRELGAVSYGAGLFSPTVEPSEYGRRFHGDDERVDVESLGLTVELWQRVVEGLWRR